MKQYVTYRRVSTAEQGRSGLGLEAQSRDIELFLSGYSDQPYEVIGEFLDVVSGTEDDRPELAKAVALAKKTGAELLVAKLDRLSRKVATISKLMDDKALTIRVASMPHADRFQLHIHAALAEQEREFISTRTKAALSQARKRGTKLGGLRDATMKRNAVVKEQAQRRAEKLKGVVMPMRDAGKTLREIAEELGTIGVQTARGGRWTATQVQRLLFRLAAGED